MATGANTTPMGRLHPVLAAKMNATSSPVTSVGTAYSTSSTPGSGSGSKDPELKRHLEAAKRAASALFPGKLGHSEDLCIIHVLCTCRCGFGCGYRLPIPSVYMLDCNKNHVAL